MTTQAMNTTTTTTTPAKTSSPRWLLWVLRANASVCIALGATALAGGQGLATWMGMPALMLLVLGVGLVAYGLIFWRIVAEPTRAIVRFVTALDVAWIVGSMALILFPILPLTDAGKITIDVIALVTADFAIAQYVGLRRMS